MAAVDLQDEPLTDEQIDAVAGDPDLAPQRQTHPPQPGHDEGLEPRVGPDLRRGEHAARTGRKTKPRERRGIHLRIPQRRLPHRQRDLERLARGDSSEHVLGGIDQGIRMPRNHRPRPVHDRGGRRRPPRVRVSGDVDPRVVVAHPPPAPARLRHARDHHARPCRRDQVRVGIRHGQPAAGHAHQLPPRHRAVERTAPVSGSPDPFAADHAPALSGPRRGIHVRHRDPRRIRRPRTPRHPCTTCRFRPAGEEPKQADPCAPTEEISVPEDGCRENDLPTRNILPSRRLTRRGRPGPSRRGRRP